MIAKSRIAGVEVSHATPLSARDAIIEAALSRRHFAVTALAVHGVMAGTNSPTIAYVINRLDLVVADGQPVRWALNWLHGAELTERVYGPKLMLDVCEKAAELGLGVFLLAPSLQSRDILVASLPARFPGLIIAGTQIVQFRKGTPAEVIALTSQVRDSGASILMVGMGCPKQEIFAYEMRGQLNIPIVSVGAAFDFHAGLAKEPPFWMQRVGLQWFHRLLQDPRRLAKRYLVLNSQYVLAILRQRWFGPPALREAPSLEPAHLI